jgi:hypothetical protein
MVISRSVVFVCEYQRTRWLIFSAWLPAGEVGVQTSTEFVKQCTESLAPHLERIGNFDCTIDAKVLARKVKCLGCDF